MRRARGNDVELGNIVNGKGTLCLSREQRATHTHIVGNTGSGKSKLLEHMVRQDILAHRSSKCGMLVIDPHGSLYDNIVKWMARMGLDRPVIPIDLRRDDWIVSYNLLRQRKTARPSVVVNSLVDAFAHVWGASGTNATPLFARWASNMLRALYDGRHTLAEAVHLLSNRPEVRKAISATVTEDLAKQDWESASTMKPREFEDAVGSSINRLRRFIVNDHMRTIFGQSHESLDLGSALEEGSIILVSLSREGAIVSKEDADLFATLLLNDLWTAAQERGKRDDAKPFYVYLDEFQRFMTPTVAESLDEARGFGLHLTLSHQFPLQLRDAGEIGRRVFNSVMENARSKICFSLSARENLELMAECLFMGTFDPDEIKHAIYSTKVMGYREELRRSYSSGSTRSTGGTHHSSISQGSGESGSAAPGGLSPQHRSWNESEGEASGATDSWSDARTGSETESSVFIPEFGQELSSIEYRSLEEQLHRAMAVLFDQEQRHYVARLVGMRAPVSVRTPFIGPVHIRDERIEKYVQQLYRSLPCAIIGDIARARLAQRHSEFPKLLLAQIDDAIVAEEPSTAKRRIRAVTPCYT